MRKYCFRLGLYRQGLTHDLSKYSPAEMLCGAKYYSDHRGPVSAERRDIGVSNSWLHHKGRNKHHPEYWIDYTIDPEGHVGFGPGKMPAAYIAEMFCDSVAAGKVYLGDKYTNSVPYDRFMRNRNNMQIHPETADEYEKILSILKDQGEDAAFRYVRNWMKSEGRKR